MTPTQAIAPAPSVTQVNVDGFIERVVSDFRRRLALLDDDGDRRAIEDAVALLTDYRLSGMDDASFERLIATMREGRSPVALAVLKPQAIASELAREYQQYVRELPTNTR
jgi:hypothetical protein